MNECVRCTQTVRPVGDDGLCDRCAHESLAKRRRFLDKMAEHLECASSSEIDSLESLEQCVANTYNLRWAQTTERIAEQEAAIERLRAQLADQQKLLDRWELLFGRIKAAERQEEES